MEILVDRIENPESWNSELEDFRGSVFMTREWLDAVSSAERTPIYLRFVKGREVLAVLGGLEILNVKKTAKQLFFYSGITAKEQDPEVIRKSKMALYEFAKSNNYYRVSMRSYDHTSYVPATLKQFKVKQRTEFITFLDKDKDEIFDKFDADIKRRARKARRDGVVFKSGNSRFLAEKLFDLLDETNNIRRSKGYGKYSYFYLPFFEHKEINKLIDTGYASFYYAEFQDEILGIQFVFNYQGKAYEIFEGTSIKGYKLNAPAFLMCEVTGLLKEMGSYYYNHGGVPGSVKHQGLQKFKEKVGAQSIPSSEEVTNFITPPLNLLNPLLNLKRSLKKTNILPGKFRSAAIMIIDAILNKRDKY